MIQFPAPQAPVPPPDLGRIVVDTGSAGPPEWLAPVIVFSLIVIVACILLYPMARAWARRHEAGAMDVGLLDEVNHLRDRVNDLEGQVSRMQELEERVDFAERLLSQREEALRLPREGGA
ncbi:MAG: hypothetical protein ABIZ70_00665 [Gemmatimonadales bacterium]